MTAYRRIPPRLEVEFLPAPVGLPVLNAGFERRKDERFALAMIQGPPDTS